MTEGEKRLTMKVIGALALLLLVAMAAGCSTLQAKFERPTVRLSSIALLEAGLTQQVYSVRLQVDNPNGFSLPVKAVNYNMRVAQTDFASGATRDAFSVPANGSDTIELEVRTNLVDSIGQIARLLQGGARELDYELSGDIRINLPLAGPVPFSQSGTIPLQTR